MTVPAAVAREPVLVAAAVQAGVAMVLGFSHLSGEQMALVITFTTAVLALYARTRVTPLATLPNPVLAAVVIAEHADVAKISLPEDAPP